MTRCGTSGFNATCETSLGREVPQISWFCGNWVSCYCKLSDSPSSSIDELWGFDLAVVLQFDLENLPRKEILFFLKELVEMTPSHLHPSTCFCLLCFS